MKSRHRRNTFWREVTQEIDTVQVNHIGAMAIYRVRDCLFVSRADFVRNEAIPGTARALGFDQGASNFRPFAGDHHGFMSSRCESAIEHRDYLFRASRCLRAHGRKRKSNV